MKILIVGGTGTIGQAVVTELSKRHAIVVASRQHSDVQVDITDTKSIEKMYQSVDKIDAVIATTGQVHFAALAEMQPEHYQIGLKSKLMGQINLVLIGMNYINAGGSFTLTSGIASEDPIRCGSSAAMVNGALDAFVKASSIELPRNLRINIVSPTILSESMEKFGDYFRGFEAVPAARVALAYSKSVEGAQTGQVYKIFR